MKELVCYLRPAKLDQLLEKLSGLQGVVSLAYGEARGYGRQKEHLTEYQEGEFSYSFLPRTKLSMALEDAAVEKAIALIQQACRSGHIGDGKILIRPISPLSPHHSPLA